MIGAEKMAKTHAPICFFNPFLLAPSSLRFALRFALSATLFPLSPLYLMAPALPPLIPLLLAPCFLLFLIEAFTLSRLTPGALRSRL